MINKPYKPHVDMLGAAIIF